MALQSSLPARVEQLARWEVVAAIGAAAMLVWAVELVLRRRWTASRRVLMDEQLRAVRNAVVAAAALWAVFRGVSALGVGTAPAVAAGLGAIGAATLAGLRVARFAVLQWLFARSRHEGVPMLLVDLFTVLASAVLFGVLLHALFRIEVASLLAGSAVLSVVLGLALQDTLGQLFAGISLQFDRPFRLGDWIEVRFGGEQITGRVLEVSWRATLLMAVGEELVTVPNRTMAQGLVINYAGRTRPFIRGHTFRFALNTDTAEAKRLLVQAALETDGVVHDPAPVAYVTETTDSWLAVRMLIFMTDYGSRLSVGDAFHTRALALLAEHGVPLAAPRLHVTAG